MVDEAGHDWEHVFHRDVLIRVVCLRCGKAPVEVMREDFSLQPCMAVEPAAKSESLGRG